MVTTRRRLWSKVNKDGPVPPHRPDLGPCWLWTAGKTGQGYGAFRAGLALARAHRFVYELLVGPIPDGLELDHLCRVHSCVNPDHLELVTHRVNTLRGLAPTALNAKKTHCPQGHPYGEENTRWWRGHRICRACHRARQRVRQARKQIAV